MKFIPIHTKVKVLDRNILEVFLTFKNFYFFFFLSFFFCVCVGGGEGGMPDVPGIFLGLPVRLAIHFILVNGRCWGLAYIGRTNLRVPFLGSCPFILSCLRTIRIWFYQTGINHNNKITIVVIIIIIIIYNNEKRYFV